MTEDIRHGWYLVGKKLHIDIYVPGLREDDVVVVVDPVDPRKIQVRIHDRTKNFNLCGTVFNPVIKVEDVKAEVIFDVESRVDFTHLCQEEKQAAMAASSTKKYAAMDEAGEKDGSNDFMDVLRQIYDKGDDNTKRAMLKSYQESGGTVLSTSWDEVKDGPVSPQYPGMG
ncbi:Sgt1-like protein [Giardia muris]|uniref:Sgt1-like protein n=1 Tax=Giardia muris TaxID=5742 RepID=A0A4Z1T7C2_GIAMU|nr:Sgt1-like protein [Giardia muris]|eukprot:TNJ29037.1 Sgt1-like protein [Giardia muris]